MVHPICTFTRRCKRYTGERAFHASALARLSSDNSQELHTFSHIHAAAVSTTILTGRLDKKPPKHSQPQPLTTTDSLSSSPADRLGGLGACLDARALTQIE